LEWKKVRINIVQTNYDPTDIIWLKEVLGDLEGITCFPECFALGRSGVETLQYLNKVSDEGKSIIETVKETGKSVILPLIEKHPVMRNRFYNTTSVIHNGDVIGTYRRVVIHPMEKPYTRVKTRRRLHLLSSIWVRSQWRGGVNQHSVNSRLWYMTSLWNALRSGDNERCHC
jgi:hypothetical protein